MPTTLVPQPDWSSLAPDLVRRVGDCILAADDIDHYMAFRIVCHKWRTAIKEQPDGKANDCDDPSCFQPSKWVLVDRDEDDDVLITLVNMETGRFVRKRIPLLRDYFFIGASKGGLILLAERAYPYQVRVLNPFTGSLARFKAPIPVAQARDVAVTTTMVFISTLDNYEGGTVMWADQDSEYFQKYYVPFSGDILCMVPFAGDVYLTNRQGSVLSLTAAGGGEGGGCTSTARSISMATAVPALGPASVEGGCYYYLVESLGELLLVTRPWYGVPAKVAIHRVDTAAKVLEPVRTIGSRALFLSSVRCLSVDAYKFHGGVEGGCVNFVDHVTTEVGYFECSFLTTVRFPDGVQLPTLDISPVPGGFRPFTLAQVFANYCKCTHYSELPQIESEEDFSDDDDVDYDDEDPSLYDDDYETDAGSSESDQ
ncbi:hypothetical protein U9M48_004135 [Paspalum notatum var. saurae]|uniref:KIB1-4 beta-propeller domain-containing protein n=1 Tax=Paspalum notatum var. saurae TaxID=547442 RepID=A0AAQ3SEL2_PASNO